MVTGVTVHDSTVGAAANIQSRKKIFNYLFTGNWTRGRYDKWKNKEKGKKKNK